MTSIQRTTAASIVLLLLAGWASGADAPITVADVRQLYADAKYDDVVKAVTKITTSREWLAKRPDGYELYTLKAEAHLRTKQAGLAIASFESAAKLAEEQTAIDKTALDKAELVAEKTATTQPVDDAVLAKYNADRLNLGVARSTIYLIKHCVGTNYFPKPVTNHGATPQERVKLDITNPDMRKQALTAIWTEEKTASAARLAAGTDMDNKSPQAVLEAAPAIASLREFDLAANGNDEDTQKTATELSERGRDLLQAMLEKMSVRLDIIKTDAFHLETQHSQLAGNASVDRYRMHGMEGKQKGELQAMEANVKDIAKAIRVLADELGAERSFFEKPLKDARRINDGADKILKTDFTETYATWEAATKAGGLRS